MGAALFVLPATAGASLPPYVTDKDVQVAVRTFGFVYGMPKGDIDIDIIYDPTDAASKNDAQQLQKILADGTTFANRSVKASLVPISSINTAKSRLAYVTHGLQTKHEALLQKVAAEKTLTFSTDFDCVNKKKCVMGVTADPNIKIEISRAASAAAGLEFSQALKLMVREVE
jgi:hypothetical protein